MRISTNMMFQNSTSALQKASERLDKANEQMTTGDKFSTAGEDPTGMSTKLSLTSKITAYQQYNTNGGLLDSSLTLEGTVLSSVTTSLQSAYTLVQQSQNGTINLADRKSIASELEELQVQVYDLMNSRNADGEYIFGGNQSQTQPFEKKSSGTYDFTGDTGQRMIQVAPSVQIAANDSGLSVFQSVATRRTATPTSTDLKISVSDQSGFNSFVKSNYDFTTSSNNNYLITTYVGSPETYDISDSNGVSLQNGNYVQGAAITFNGLSLTLDVAAGGTAQSFSVDKPENDNILNTLQQMIDALNNESISSDDFAAMAADTEVHLKNTMDRVDITQGAVGGRQNNLEQVMDSNSALSTINKEARANVSEVDLYEAISNVAQQENALTLAQQAFSQVNKSTHSLLFNA